MWEMVPNKKIFLLLLFKWEKREGGGGKERQLAQWFCLNSETKPNWLLAPNMNEEYFLWIKSVLCCYNVTMLQCEPNRSLTCAIYEFNSCHTREKHTNLSKPTHTRFIQTSWSAIMTNASSHNTFWDQKFPFSQNAIRHDQEILAGATCFVFWLLEMGTEWWKRRKVSKKKFDCYETYE